MPELAEVETVRNVLKDRILNKKILDINIIYPKIIENDIAEFKEKLINDFFIDIKRKGKYLIFETNNYYLVSHLRMEGKFFVKDINAKIEKHEHVIFSLENISFRYHDTRKFGRMKVINKNELDDYLHIGPDANLCDDANYLYNSICKKSLPIKTALLDQSIIAGLGNIYVDEVLFASHINPNRRCQDVTLKDATNILTSSKIILNNAIKYKGTTIRTYTSSLNVKGEYQKFLKVHTKDTCECGCKISKTRISGRSTYYCPNCQK